MGRRGPKSWTTTEEEVFLAAQLPDYMKCQPSRVYGKFWADTFRAFFNHWPERARLHIEEKDLTSDQEAILRKDIKERQTVSIIYLT
jgi:hypothetical protein